MSLLCISCSVVTNVEATGLDAARSVYDSLAVPFAQVLTGGFGIWLLLKLANGLMGDAGIMETFKEVAGGLFGVFTCLWMLSDSDTYYLWVYQPLSSMIFGIAGINLSASPEAGSDINGLALTVEDNFSKVIDVTFAIFGIAGWDISYYLAGALLAAPFFVQVVVLVVQIVWAQGLLLFPFAAAPYLMVAGCFKFSRRLLLAMLEMYLGAGATLAVATFFVGIFGAVSERALAGLPAVNGGAMVGEQTGLFGSSAFWGAVITGWISILFVYKAETIAAYITNRIDLQRQLPKLPKAAGGK